MNADFPDETEIISLVAYLQLSRLILASVQKTSRLKYVLIYVLESPE